jgi:type I restriction enzyme S subunit
MSLPNYSEYQNSGIEWLGHIPQKWTVCKLSHRYSVELGKMLHEKKISGENLIPYLRNQDVQWDAINVDGLPEMDIHGEELERYTVRFGDLLVCEGGDVGRAAIWRRENGEIGFQKAIHRLRAKKISRDTAEFFYFVLISAKQNRVFDESGNQATIAHLPAERFRQYRFPFPDLVEQRAIATFLRRETAKIDALIAEQEKLIALLAEKRQAAISHAVTKGLNPNSPMKDSGVEWLGNVPEHWLVSALSYLCSIETGATPDRGEPKYWDGSIPWIKTGEISWKPIFESEEFISEEALANSAAKIAKPGTLMMAMYGQGVTRGRVAILRISASFNQACAAISFGPRLSTEYGRYFFMAAYDHIRDGGNETSQMNLSAGFIAKIKLPVPPVEEQMEIVHHLDAATASLDALSAKASRGIVLLKERRNALISAAVTGKVDVRQAVQQEQATIQEAA